MHGLILVGKQFLVGLAFAIGLFPARVQRGRPKSPAPKISTTLRLDPEVLEAFKSSGPGWQSRMNEALRKAVGL